MRSLRHAEVQWIQRCHAEQGRAEDLEQRPEGRQERGIKERLIMIQDRQTKLAERPNKPVEGTNQGNSTE